MKLFVKYSEPIIGRSSSAFDFNGNALLVVFDNEVHLIISFTPIVQLIVIFICLIKQISTNGTFYPTSP